MAIADYRFPTPRREENLKLTATRRLMDQGLRPSSLRSSESEPAGDVVGKWNAAIAAEAQAIKESRDPKRERERQLGQLAAGKAGADTALKKAGVTPEDFWTSEEGLTKTSFTERTGEKIDIPKEAQVGAVSREMETPEGGLIRQVAGPYGFASVKYTPEGATALAQQRASDEARAIQFQGSLAALQKNRVERDKERGREVAAKLETWQADKEALAEGTAIQRDARKRLSRINRALRQDARYRQEWEGGSGDVEPMTTERYLAMMDEKSQLEAALRAREGVQSKGVTQLGYDARAKQEQRVAEQRRLREAALAGVETFATQTRAAARQATSPLTSAANDLLQSYALDLTGENGIFESMYPGLYKPKGSK